MADCWSARKHRPSAATDRDVRRIHPLWRRGSRSEIGRRSAGRSRQLNDARKKLAPARYARRGPLVTRREGNCLLSGPAGKRGKPRQCRHLCLIRGIWSLNAACSLCSGNSVQIQSVSRLWQQGAQESTSRSRQAASATFLEISFFSLRTFGLSLSSLVLSTQLSRPPTCSTERRP